ncbi:transcription factor [Vermiconidia calcicola]|uniref:Transcription factor n=1 Tax=Vermiconidia calcicola TaxID=1690605 RepID=A0ACC3N9X3_9PEZI|nr:transcription factor [Vermiconidia calcicola]
MATRSGVQGIDIPTFRVKRSHKKSRLGCITCKRRRIKCDETRPCCDRCNRRGLDCAYEELAAQAPITPDSLSDQSAASNAKASPKSKLSSSAGPSPTADIPLVVSGVLEADLAQHYLAHTAKTFAETSLRAGHSDSWHVMIPSLAYTSSPVRLGMLTAAALCLHYDTNTDSTQSTTYVQAAYLSGTRFVAESSQQLRDWKSVDLPANLACSKLLCVLAVAWFRVHRSEGTTIPDAAAWTWLQMLQGLKTVHFTISESAQQVGINRSGGPEQKVPVDDDPLQGQPLATLQRYAHPAFSLIQQSHQERFDALHHALLNPISDLTEQQTTALVSATKTLEDLSSHICTGQVRNLIRTIFFWPSQLSKESMDLLINGHSLALVIHAHWLMLVVLAEDLWWVSDMGRSGIRDIVGLIDRLEMDGDVETLSTSLHWPRQLLDLPQSDADPRY